MPSSQISRPGNGQPIATSQEAFRLLGATNVSRATVPTAAGSLAPATGEPTVPAEDGVDAKFVISAPPRVEFELCPFGSGAAGKYYRGQVIHCRELLAGTGTGVQVIRRPLVAFNGTLGARVGASGMSVGTGDRFSDVITIENDYTPGSGAKVSTVASGISTLSFDARGPGWLEVEFACGTGGVPSGVTGTGATSMNGLWAGL